MLIGHERAGGLHSGRCGALFGGLGQHGGEVACFGRGCGLGAGSLDAFGQGVRLALEGISDGYGSRRAALGPGDGFRHGRCRRKSAFRCQLREGRLGELPQGGSGLLGFGTTFGLVQKLVQERRDASPRPGPDCDPRRSAAPQAAPGSSARFPIDSSSARSWMCPFAQILSSGHYRAIRKNRAGRWETV